MSMALGTVAVELYIQSSATVMSGMLAPLHHGEQSWTRTVVHNITYKIAG